MVCVCTRRLEGAYLYLEICNRIWHPYEGILEQERRILLRIQFATSHKPQGPLQSVPLQSVLDGPNVTGAKRLYLLKRASPPLRSDQSPVTAQR